MNIGVFHDIAALSVIHLIGILLTQKPCSNIYIV